MFKKLAVAFVLVTSFTAAEASVSQKSIAGTEAAVTSAHTFGAAQSGIIGTVAGRVSGAPELASLLFIGTVFIGSATLFSSRRPTA